MKFLHSSSCARSTLNVTSVLRVGANEVAQDKRGGDADRTLRSSGVFLDHEPLTDVMTYIAIVERDRVLGRAVESRVDLEDFSRPLVE